MSPQPIAPNASQQDGAALSRRPPGRIGWCAGAAVSLLALAACASPPLATGLAEAEVRARWGPPTGVLSLPGGERRLEYATGPFGKQTWMVDLDASGRVSQWQQVLQEARFDQVRAGMTGEELRRFIGRPSVRRAGGWPGGEVWSWRYDAIFCQWFQASLDDAGRVTSTAYGPDPLCEQNDRRLGF